MRTCVLLVLALSACATEVDIHNSPCVARSNMVCSALLACGEPIEGCNEAQTSACHGGPEADPESCAAALEGFDCNELPVECTE